MNLKYNISDFCNSYLKSRNRTGTNIPIENIQIFHTKMSKLPAVHKSKKDSTEYHKNAIDILVVIDYVKLFAPLFVLLLLFKKQKGK